MRPESHGKRYGAFWVLIRETHKRRARTLKSTFWGNWQVYLTGDDVWRVADGNGWFRVLKQNAEGDYDKKFKHR